MRPANACKYVRQFHRLIKMVSTAILKMPPPGPRAIMEPAPVLLQKKGKRSRRHKKNRRRSSLLASICWTTQLRMATMQWPLGMHRKMQSLRRPPSDHSTASSRPSWPPRATRNQRPFRSNAGPLLALARTCKGSPSRVRGRPWPTCCQGWLGSRCVPVGRGADDVDEKLN